MSKTANSRVPSHQLTAGEALYVARRRSKATQEDEARRHGVPILAYHKWESDVPSLTPSGDEREVPSAGIRWRDLTAVEKCVVLRRRSGVPRSALARKLGVSEHWLSAMESGRQKPGRLLAYWGLNQTAT